MPLFRRPDIAYWSTPRQLRRAGLFADEGLILGSAHGRLLRDNGDTHMLVVAGTGSGKSTCLVLPNLLTWPESVVVYDPSEELVEGCVGWRSGFSRVVQLAPTSSTSQCWNPLDAIRLRTEQEMRDAQLLAEMLTDPGQRGADKRTDTSEHFSDMAAEAVGGLLLYGLYTQQAQSLGALNALLVQKGYERLLKAMKTYPHAGIQRAGMVLSRTNGQNESSGIFSTLSRTLRLYTDPLLARCTDHSQFTLRDLRERERPMSLFLTIPFRDQERLRPWTRMILRQVMDYCMTRVDGWRWNLLGIFDEFPSLRRLTLVHEGLGRVRKYGMRLMVITPSLEELIATYGQHHSFLEGCKLKVAFGLEDIETPKVFSQRCGETEVSRRKQVGRGQWVRDRVKEPLLSPTALQNLPPDRALVIAGQAKVLACKTYYLDNAVWAARSQVVCGG